jgi:hypothetical protein
MASIFAYLLLLELQYQNFYNISLKKYMYITSTWCVQKIWKWLNILQTSLAHLLLLPETMKMWVDASGTDHLIYSIHQNTIVTWSIH